MSFAAFGSDHYIPQVMGANLVPTLRRLDGRTVKARVLQSRGCAPPMREIGVTDGELWRVDPAVEAAAMD